jgi:hypothetical protein
MDPFLSIASDSRLRACAASLMSDERARGHCQSLRRRHAPVRLSGRGPLLPLEPELQQFANKRAERPMSRIIVVIVLWFFPTWAAAQQNGASRDRLSAMQRVMPIGSICADLDWESVSYCRFHSKGATLEIWSGVYGPGATLSFDSAGKQGLALIPAIRAHFLLEGVAIEKLNQCIGNYSGFQVQVSGKLLDLQCRFVELADSLSLEIFAEPVR